MNRLADWIHRHGKDAAFSVAFAGLLTLAAVYVSDRSFWIDEIRTGVKVFQPTFRLFWARLDAFAGGDVCIQMPLYMVLEWCWEKFAGSGEWALRSINVLFAAGMFAALATERALPRRVRLWAATFLAFSPMTAAYMDEARPYVLLELGATLALCGALRFDGVRFAGSPLRFLAGVVLLCAASLSGVPFAVALCACLALRAVRSGSIRACLRANAASFAAACVPLAALAVWYGWTLLAGYGGAGPAGTTPATLAFDAYEALGFLGLGPGRAELRAAFPGVFLRSPASLALLVALAAAYALFLFAALAAWRRRDASLFPAPSFPPAFATAAAAAALGCAATVAAGSAAHSRILARHLVPALPALFLAFGFASDAVVRRLPRGRALLLPLLALLLLSSLRLRFSAVHDKDDYRSAARRASEAVLAGEEVWWAADVWAPEFYGIPASPSFRVVPNAAAETLRAGPPPRIAILSKPDIYDRPGAVRARLGELGLVPAEHFPGFSLFRIP